MRTGPCHIEGTLVLTVDCGRMEDMLVLWPQYEQVSRQGEGWLGDHSMEAEGSCL